MKDKKNKPKINKLCSKCYNKCKQSADVILFSCPNYEYEPQQLELKFRYYRRRKNENNHRKIQKN